MFAPLYLISFIISYTIYSVNMYLKIQYIENIIINRFSITLDYAKVTCIFYLDVFLRLLTSASNIFLNSFINSLEGGAMSSNEYERPSSRHFFIPRVW